MGTRHIFLVQKDSEYKVAQYGQWDGYPSGQGQALLEFLKTPGFLDKLREKIDNTVFITQEDHLKLIKDLGIESTEYFTQEQSNLFFSKYPHLSRNVSVEVLKFIIESGDTPLQLKNSYEFAGDSLFCEWGYVLDLDKNVLEVYKGFNHAASYSGRFNDLIDPKSEYAPIFLIKSYSLDDLPSLDDFISLESYGQEEEEEA